MTDSFLFSSINCKSCSFVYVGGEMFCLIPKRMKKIVERSVYERTKDAEDENEIVFQQMGEKWYRNWNRLGFEDKVHVR